MYQSMKDKCKGPLGPLILTAPVPLGHKFRISVTGRCLYGIVEKSFFPFMTLSFIALFH